MPGNSAFSLSGSVSFIGRDCHVERDEVEAAPDRLIDGAQARFMIAGDDEFELRRVFKKILPHERAAILSPPVSVLIRLSAQCLPSSVSIAVTNRAPRKPASSIGWRSPLRISD
jgi:hypothetical protein